MENCSQQQAVPAHRFLAAYVRFAESVSIAFGRLMGLFIIALVLLIVYEVTRRYFFHSPTIWGTELQTFIYGATCMLSIPYATYKNSHARVDILLRKCPPRVQFYLEILYIFIFFIPFMAVLVWFETEVAYHSWATGEQSAWSSWQPLLYPIKSAIPAGAALVLIQGFAELAKIIMQNQGGEHHEL